MKILSLFIDMLRPNLLNIVDQQRPESPVDRFIRELGGKLFVNCYTPAPDSGRSLACFWSGKYPKRNGCDKRIKYPRFFLRDEHHFLEILHKRGFQLNFYVNPNEKELGVLPNGYELIGNHNTDMDLDAYTKNLVIGDHSFTYISLTDFHWAIDDYGNIERGVQKGFEQVSNSLRIIQRNLNLDQFDLIVMFSDHGLKLAGEIRNQPKYQLLNEDRSRIFMLTKTKGESELSVHTKLCSIMDLAPTLLEVAGVEIPEISFDGVSLFEPTSCDYIVLEDHLDFAPRVNQSIELWAVRTERGVYYRTLDQFYSEEYEAFQPEDQRYLDELLATTAGFFAEAMQERRVLLEYEKLQLVQYKKYYTDGSRRNPMEDNLSNLSGKKVIVFGTGEVGSRIYSLLKDRVAYYVDNNAGKWNQKFLGIEIKSPSTLLAEDKENIAVIVASTVYYDEISDQLEGMGLNENRHYYSSRFIPLNNEVSN